MRGANRMIPSTIAKSPACTSASGVATTSAAISSAIAAASGPVVARLVRLAAPARNRSRRGDDASDSHSALDVARAAQALAGAHRSATVVARAAGRPPTTTPPERIDPAHAILILGFPNDASANAWAAGHRSVVDALLRDPGARSWIATQNRGVEVGSLLDEGPGPSANRKAKSRAEIPDKAF